MIRTSLFDFASRLVIATMIGAFALPLTACEDEMPGAKNGKSAPSAYDPKDPRPRILIDTSEGMITAELFADETPKTVATIIGLAEGTHEFLDHKTGKKVKRPFYDGLSFHRVIKGFMIQGGCQIGNGGGGIGKPFEDEINADSLGLDKDMAFKGVAFDAKMTPDNQGYNLLLRELVRGADKRIAQDMGGIRQIAHGVVFMNEVKAAGIKETDEEAVKAKWSELWGKTFDKLNKLSMKKFYEHMGYKYSTAHKSSLPVRGALALANAGPNTNGSQFFINLVDTPHLTGKHAVFGRVVSGMDIVDKIALVKVGQGAKPVTPVRIISIRVAPKAAITK